MKTNKRSIILQWRSENLIQEQELEFALQSTGCEQTASDWRDFLKQMFLGLGATAISTGVIFFFAYNWQEIGRFTKFALVESVFLSVTFLFYQFSNNRNIATVTLMSMALLIGALLALVGQTYQTGADPWQLFAAWAVLVTPWALIASATSLWILWILLVNLSFVLYLNISTSVFGFLLDEQIGARLLVMINSLLLVTFESYTQISKSPASKNKRAIQLLAVLAGMAIFALAFEAIFSSKPSVVDLIFYALWMALIYLYYRYRSPDLFIIAAGTLSLGAILICLLIDTLEFSFGEGAFLLVSFSIIGLSTAAGIWLKKLAREFKANQSGRLQKEEKNANLVTKEDNQPTEQKLWQKLKQLNIVGGEEPQQSEQISPWYIRAMQGFGGWIAGLFLLGFIGAFLSNIFDPENWLLLVILALMGNGLSFFLSKEQNKNEFLQQLGLVFNLTGQLLFVWGLYQLFNSWGAGLFFLLFLYQLMIVYFVPDYSSRIMTSWFAMIALSATLERLGLTNLSMLITALIFVFVWSKDAQWGSRLNLWQPIGYGVSLSLLLVHGQNVFSPIVDWLNESTNYSELGLASYWLSEIALACLFIYLVTTIAKKYEVVLASISGALLLAGLLLILALHYIIPGMSSALLLLLVGFMRQRSILLGLGVIALISFISRYYYLLDITLLTKSITLIAFGIVLVIAFVTISKLFNSTKEQETLQDTGKASPSRIRSDSWYKSTWFTASITLLILLLVNFSIYQKEHILRHGQPVLLELAPVDPRSLMQGDYMRLRFDIESALLDKIQNKDSDELLNSGKFVVSIDKNQVASNPKLYLDENLLAGQVAMRFRIRHSRIQLATHAFFFQEGAAEDYETAKYGEFRVAENGELLLNNLRDESFRVLGYNRPSN